MSEQFPPFFRTRIPGWLWIPAVVIIPVLIMWLLPDLLTDDPHRHVSRVTSNMRSMAYGIEAYYIDHGRYPAWIRGRNHNANALVADKETAYLTLPSFQNPDGRPLAGLTTPLAYLEKYFDDPMAPEGATFSYYSVHPEPGENSEPGWILWSMGPDGKSDLDFDTVRTLYDPDRPDQNRPFSHLTYDATNGAKSPGDVLRTRQR